MTDVNNAADQNNQDTQNAGSGDEVITIPVSKMQELFGKPFKTVEDVAKSIKEAERRMHEATGEAARWRKATEDLLAVGAGRSNEPDPAQNNQPVRVDDETLAQALATKPLEVLATLAKEIESRVESKFQSAIYTRETVRDFFANNPDMKAESKLFAAYLQETNPTEPLTKRLQAAGDATRAYLTTLIEKGRQAERESSKDKALAGATGSGEASPASAAKQDDTSSGGDSFEDYFKERNQSRLKPLL